MKIVLGGVLRCMMLALKYESKYKHAHTYVRAYPYTHTSHTCVHVHASTSLCVHARVCICACVSGDWMNENCQNADGSQCLSLGDGNTGLHYVILFT